MSESQSAYLENLRTARDTLVSAMAGDANASVDAYGVKYTRVNLKDLDAAISRASLSLARRSTGMMTYADVRGSM